MQETFKESFDGTKLYYKKETAPDNKAVVVIVHGLCEHQGRYDYFAEKLHAAGFGTYRFDHRGHGRSEGEETYYEDYNELLDDTNVFVDMAIEENPDIPVFLLGHSMGGFTVSLYGVKYPDKKLRGILISGGLTADNQGIIRSLEKGMDPHIKLPNELGGGVCSVQEVVDWYGKDPYNRKTYTTGLVYALSDGLDWYDFRKQSFAYPVLIAHGEKDGLVSVNDSYELFDKVASRDKQLKIYGNLFHEILNEYCKDEVIEDFIRWMDRRISEKIQC